MSIAMWALLIGVLLTSMVLVGTRFTGLPMSAAMIYLAVGYALGPALLDVVHLDPFADPALLAPWAEAGLLISLFGAGLKLGVPVRDSRWLIPIALAFPALALTVMLIGALAVLWLNLPWGAAIVLGAILAPTDPVLASGVQAESGGNPDPVRFALTAEGALNDGAAFPFVLLGLGLLGAHELGHYGWRWVLIDLVWATLAGLAVGAGLGALIGRLIVHLRTRHRWAIGLEEFLVLGLICMTYGVAALARSSSFLAVFAAGLALQHVRERPLPGTERLGLRRAARRDAQAERAIHSHHASAALTEAALGFNLQLEKLVELGLVLLFGAMLHYAVLAAPLAWCFALAVFVLVRPLAVALMPGSARAGRRARVLLAWFGIRGIGSLFYLLYVLGQGLDALLARQLVTYTLVTVAASIVVHGISVQPMMRWYARRRAPP